MSATPTKVTPAQLGTSATTIYTVPAGKTAIIKEVILLNTHTSSLAVDLHYVPASGSAAATNQVLDVTMDPGQTIYLSGSTVLEAGATIQGLAGTASKISVRASVIEF